MIAEYVTIGHPDRMADLMAAKLITILQTSPEVHAAIEVMCVNKTVIFAGECNVEVNKKLLKEVVREVMKDCGYERKTNFKKDDFVTARDIKIINKINKQSSDIAQSTTDKKECSGWNDQGIFFASYNKTTPTGQSPAKFIAQSFGDFLFETAKKNTDFGTDIKVLVESVDFFVQRVVIAIPTTYQSGLYTMRALYCKWCSQIKEEYDIEINKDVSIFEVNTSGKYQKHGMIADTGLSGRKLAVNCLDINYKNGGGSMIKPWHAADLLVPLILREIEIENNQSDLSATTAIGSRQLSIYDNDELIDIVNIDLKKEAEKFGLFDGHSYYEMVKENYVR